MRSSLPPWMRSGWRLAWQNLTQNKVRLIVSVGGVGLALSLILALDAIMAGIQQQVTAYIDQSEADVFVAQLGVRNMHMASSSLPATATEQIPRVAGVESVTPIFYLTNLIVTGNDRHLAYIIGLPAAAEAGGPRRIVAGKAFPDSDETIIDRGVANKSGIGIGDAVQILGQEFRVAGLSEGMANPTSSVAFLTARDFARLAGRDHAVSFVLVRVGPGNTPESVASRIEERVPGVTAQSRRAFAAQERQVINDMSTDIINIMNLVGFLIGLAVMALTVYTATLARRAEYGILVPRLGLDLSLQLDGSSLLKAALFSVVITAGSASSQSDRLPDSTRHQFFEA